MKEVLASHRIERDELLKRAYIPRAGLEKAVQCMSGGLIKVVIGPRRAGKSVFAMQMLSRACGADFAYVNFDDERLRSPMDLDDLLAAMIQVYGPGRTVLFDEIQNVAGWELFVNRLQRRGYNLVLTGSNAHLLSRELSTHLTGRYREFRLLPFSFAEVLKARDVAVDDRLVARERQGLLLKHLDDYLNAGGFPEVVVGGADADSYLATLFDSILLKDVVQRHNVRYAAKLRDVGRWLVGNAAREYTCSSLKKSLAFRSVHTVGKYVAYLVEAYLFLSVERYSPKAKLRMTAPRKIYGYDTGMVNAVRFKAGRDAGRLLENAVAVELYRRGAEFYAYKSTAGKETDFAVKSANREIQLIQVCYDLAEAKTRSREVQSLMTAGRELGVGNGLVLTWDEEGTETVSGFGIRLLPAWKWLLGLEGDG